MGASEEVKYQDLKMALLAATKTVKIQIADTDLRNLKDNDYLLCFAKKVGDNAYNVIWQAYDKYLSNNVFSWTPQYQLFGTNNFQANTQVSTQTNLLSIGLGESSTLDKYGLLNPPASGGPSNAVSLVNQYGNIYPGVSQISTGIDGSITSTPVYVTEKASITGTTTSLIPVEKLIVWFQQNAITSMMFSNVNGTPVEIDLSIADAAARLYSNGQWTTI